jgi:hypothetical protein
LTILIGAGLCVATAYLLVAGSPSLWVIVGTSAVAIAALVFWRPAVYALLILVMVEGFIRNLVDNPEFLLLKDVAIVAIYIRVIHIRWSRGERMIPAQTIGLPLLALTIVAGVESLNPQLVNPLQPLVGIRTWLFYIPLYIVGLAGGIPLGR